MVTRYPDPKDVGSSKVSTMDFSIRNHVRYTSTLKR